MHPRKKLKRILTVTLSAGAILLSCLFGACSGATESGHDLEHVENRQASCIEEGVVEHWHCKSCGKNFSDENAETEVERVSVALKSHLYNVGYHFDDDNHYSQCSVCGYINDSTVAAHIKKYEATESEHFLTCFCGWQGGGSAHVSDVEGEPCEVCLFGGLLYELSDDGTYYICKGAPDASKNTVEEFIVPDTHKGKPVKEVASRAFDNCAALERITLGANVISVSSYAFKDCKKLVSVTLNEGLLEIGNDAFLNCEALESIVLPESLTILKNAAFQNCTSLREVNIPKSLTTIENNTFYGCTALESIELHSAVVSIERAAFSKSGVKEFVVPDGVRDIPMTMFESCASLVSVTIPASVKSFGVGSLMNCKALETINYLGTAEQWEKIEFGNMWNMNSDGYTVNCLG